MKLLKNKNFLYLLLGRIIANIGDSIYYVAAMWLVYRLGGSAFYSGLAGFLTLLPVSLQFITGPFVDRWPVKRTLIITQVLQAVIISIIPLAFYFDILTVQIILIVMPIVSFIGQLAYPTQTKALPMILPKKQLIKGNSYFSFAYQGVDMVFNAISGILIAIFGAIVLFVADSFIFTIAAMLFVVLKIPHTKEEKVPPKQGIKQGITNYFSELKEGFSVVFGSLMATFLIASIIANFSIGGALAILPALADTRGGAEFYGLYLAAMSMGGLIGAMAASWMGKFRLGLFTIFAFFLGAVCWVLAALPPWPYVTIVLFGLAWVPIGGTNVIFAATVQTVVPYKMLGRINTVSSSMSTIAMPIGSLACGYFATVSSSVFMFALTGFGLAFVSIVWLLHKRLRSLPEVEHMNPEVLGIAVHEEEGSVRS